MLDDTNSYVTLDEAEAYFANRLDAAAWDEAKEVQKEQALVTAAQTMETLDWVGSIVDPSQPLAWPRKGYFFDPRLGYTVEIDDIPARVKTAQMELAYHLLNNDGVLDTGGGVKSVKVGPIEITGIRSASAVSSVASKMLSPLLNNRGAAVWRAN